MQLGKYEISLDEIVYLSKRFRFGIIGLIMLVLLVLVYWFDTRDQAAKLQQGQTQEQALKTQLSDYYQQSTDSLAYQEQIRVLQQQVNGFLEKLPDQTELPNLLENITRLAELSGVVLADLNPEKPREVEFYRLLPITLKATGSYQALATFISYVENSDEMLLLGNWQMQLQIPSTTQEQIVMTMTLNSLRHQQDTKRLALGGA